MLKPGAAEGKDAFINDFNSVQGGITSEFNSKAWMNSGNVFDIRGLIGFDLSSIATNAYVDSAFLTQY